MTGNFVSYCKTYSYRAACIVAGKRREQGRGSFAYMDVGKGREQGRGSFENLALNFDLRPSGQGWPYAQGVWMYGIDVSDCLISNLISQTDSRGSLTC